jgi:hypothetical protein
MTDLILGRGFYIVLCSAINCAAVDLCMQQYMNAGARQLWAVVNNALGNKLSCCLIHTSVFCRYRPTLTATANPSRRFFRVTLSIKLLNPRKFMASALLSFFVIKYV